MAIHTSSVFEGFRGSINRQLVFRQYFGKTVVSKFPDRSSVIYTENQKREQKRFSDAVSFARIVIADAGLKQIYSIRASLLGFRSAWNAAIAEYMSDKPLSVKKKKIRFEKSVIISQMGKNTQVKLYKTIEGTEQVFIKIPRGQKAGRNFKADIQDRPALSLSHQQSTKGVPRP